MVNQDEQVNLSTYKTLDKLDTEVFMQLEKS